jgi:hypothetical protein
MYMLCYIIAQTSQPLCLIAASACLRSDAAGRTIGYMSDALNFCHKSSTVIKTSLCPLTVTQALGPQLLSLMTVGPMATRVQCKTQSSQSLIFATGPG